MNWIILAFGVTLLTLALIFGDLVVPSVQGQWKVRPAQTAQEWDAQDHKTCLATLRGWSTEGQPASVTYARCMTLRSNIRILWMLERGCADASACKIEILP
jgi:hypothetical protein